MMSAERLRAHHRLRRRSPKKLSLRPDGYVTAAGIEFDPKTEKVSLHCFRHAAAHRMLREGLDVQRVAVTLGDTVQTVVSTYLRAEEHDKATETDPAVVDVKVAA
jgi:site-specific recombinase XerD